MRYLFLLLVIGASIATFSTVIIPRYKALQAVRGEVSTYDGRLATAQKLKVSRDELIAKYNSITKADLDGVRSLLPDSVDNIRLIIQLDSLATKNGMSSLRNVQYDEVKAAVDSTQKDASVNQKPYGEFAISFETAGQYKNFLSFISDLEQNLRLVDIVGVDFSAADQSQNAGDSMRYKVSLKTYWLKK